MALTIRSAWPALHTLRSASALLPRQVAVELTPPGTWIAGADDIARGDHREALARRADVDGRARPRGSSRCQRPGC